MSQIPFLNELGDALETTIARQRRGSNRGRGPRLHTSRRAMVLAALATALLGGGVAVAATLLSTGGQKLADGQVNCFFNTAPTAALRDQPNSGSNVVSKESPIAQCRQSYNENRHFHNAPDADPDPHGFVACQAAKTTINVYVSDDQPNQCQRVGNRPLPPTYPAAAHQLQTLQTDLVKIQRDRGCESPQAMSTQIRRTLRGVGLPAWRIVLPPAHTPAKWDIGPAGTGGTCASLTEASWDNDPRRFSAPLFSNHKIIYISLGPPQLTAARMYTVGARLYQQTYRHCYTTTSVRALVRRAFAPLGLQARFATRGEQKGSRFEPASERLYKNGCLRYDSEYPGNNNRYVDILLLSIHAPQLRSGEFYPPASAFKP
jgi:hypothetical protein